MNKIPSSERLGIRNICSHSDHLDIFCMSNGGIIKFHNPTEDKTWISAVSSLFAELEIFCGCPTSILEVQNAIFVPDFHCLYDSAGHRILESCIRRGVLLDQIVGAPETIAVPNCMASVDLPLVYLGPIIHHWGHFLTESISRLWSLDGYLPGEDSLLLFGGNSGDPSSPINQFLNAGTLEQLRNV